jgi:hypothetical protein
LQHCQYYNILGDWHWVLCGHLLVIVNDSHHKLDPTRSSKLKLQKLFLRIRLDMMSDFLLLFSIVFKIVNISKKKLFFKIIFGWFRKLEIKIKKENLNKTWVEFEFNKTTQTYISKIIKYNKKKMYYANMPLIFTTSPSVYYQVRNRVMLYVILMSLLCPSKNEVAFKITIELVIDQNWILITWWF